MKYFKRFKMTYIGIAALFLFMGPLSAAGRDVKPNMIRWANYGVTSSSYVQGTAVAEGILKKFDIKIRTIPLGSGKARLMAVKEKQADFLFTGCDSALSWRGRADWAARKWGPQKIRTVMLVNLKSTFALATRGDSGVKTLHDLKGRKVAYVVGSPSLNAAVEGALNLVGLNWNDVQKVNFPGLGAGYKAVRDGVVTTVGVNAASPIAYEMDASPGGIHWIPYPKKASNPKGWEDFNNIYPGTFPITATVGGGITGKKPVYTAHFAFPAIFTYASTSENMAYWQIKAIAESYELYKNSSPDLPQWDIKKFVNIPLMGWYAPLHSGAVKYLKERNLWTNEMDIKQKAMLYEEIQRLNLWAQTVKQADAKGMSDEEFKGFWLAKLKKAELY